MPKDPAGETDRNRIGVMGGGTVGNAVAAYYRATGAEVRVFDKFKPLDSLEATLAQTYLFVAVPTNLIGNQIDLSAVDEAMQNASRSSARAVILKSTVTPGTTDHLQSRYPHLKIVFNPEFLTELTALHDFSHPARQLIGTTANSLDVADEVMALLPPAPFSRVMPAASAELVKYFFNTWRATKIAFSNQMYDVAEHLGIDYNVVVKCAASDPCIGDSHLDVWRDGYRGYSGKCLPKDTQAFISFAEHLGVEMKLLKTVEEINASLVKGNIK